MAAPDYSFYTDTYGGSASEANFNAQLPAAVAQVDWMVWPNEVWADQEEAYKKAVCACVDVYLEYGTGYVGGFTIGSFRVDSGTGKVSASDIAVDKAARYLVQAGLMWGGLR